MPENEYLSVTEFAKLHNKDVGNIRRLIAAGRIPAKKIGNQWAIPSDAQLPEDQRVKTGKYKNLRKKESE